MIMLPAYYGFIGGIGFNKTDMIAWWSLDEADNSSARADSHTNSLDLTNVNNVSYAAGFGGSYLNLYASDFEVGSSMFLERADEALLSTGDIDFTFCCWIKTESQANAMVIASKHNSTSVREWMLQYNQSSDRLQFVIYDSGGTNSGQVSSDEDGDLTNAAWHFVVAWHDSVNDLVGIQVDNQTADTAATSGVPSDTAANFRIGARNTTESDFFDGLIDEAVFFKRLLTDDEKTYLYNNGSGRSYSDLV